MVAGKLPAGSSISKLKASFQEEYSLGALGLEGVMVSSLVCEPTERLDNAALAAWRASVVRQYGEYAGQPVSSKGGGGGGDGGAAAVATGAVDPRMAAKLNSMVTRLAGVYRDYLDEDPLQQVKALEMEQGLRGEVDARMAAITEELGEDYISGVQPYFQKEKVREYNDWWALAKRDALILWDELHKGEKAGESSEKLLKRTQNIKNRMTHDCKKLLLWLAQRSSCGKEPAERG